MSLKIDYSGSCVHIN